MQPSELAAPSPARAVAAAKRRLQLLFRVPHTRHELLDMFGRSLLLLLPLLLVLLVLLVLLLALPPIPVHIALLPPLPLWASLPLLLLSLSV